LWPESRTLSHVTSLLDRVAKNENDIKELNNTQSKMQYKISIKCTSIVKELQTRNTDFYTYKMKDEKSFKDLLKNVLLLVFSILLNHYDL